MQAGKANMTRTLRQTRRLSPALTLLEWIGFVVLMALTLAAVALALLFWLTPPRDPGGAVALILCTSTIWVTALLLRERWR